MRNPIRLKNLNIRFLPLYVIGVSIFLLRPPSREALALGLPLVALGALLRGWGAGHLVKNDVLTTTGPYAYLRHPLYAGTILIGTGFALALGDWLSLLAVLALWPWFALDYFPRKERSEAERLESLYGGDFVHYRRAVPALWPRWRAWRGSKDEKAGGRDWALERYSGNNELGTLLAVVVGWAGLWLRAGVGGS
jgi:protein-S-isoprenylcysteine O-methyltransferase Ste14